MPKGVGLYGARAADGQKCPWKSAKDEPYETPGTELKVNGSEIDQLVPTTGMMYGLSEEEIRIVEGE